ncbi:MAG: ATP-dependent DNA helicase RecG, partial [Gammaproteobacteria bacterium]|nr:ATP-dependent DNA helicase RecG [Gammaproteobacteria bacterium]
MPSTSATLSNISKLSEIQVSKLNGVGPKVAEKLTRLGINNVEDLLFHFPHRYQDKSRIQAIGSLRYGQTAQICARIEACDIVYGKRRSLLCRVSDDTGIMDIRLFYFSMAQKKQFIRGQYLQCYGQVSFVGRYYTMVHPEMKYLKDSSDPILQKNLQAFYPATEGLQQNRLSKIIAQALDYLDKVDINELMPDKWMQKHHFPDLKTSLKQLHQPPASISLNDLQNGSLSLVKRLAFEELVAQQVALKIIKSSNAGHSAINIPIAENQIQQFRQQLPFELTAAQDKVIATIQKDMNGTAAMMRLVQGDVGSGKTLVAAFALLSVLQAGKQGCFMAPTELLAEQHFKNFSLWFKPFNIEVCLLTSKLSKSNRTQILQQIQSGQSQLIIGTHALFQADVHYQQLALVIIDEQHRFGVEQRKQLLEKAYAANSNKFQPHQLVMTATPIPRTLTQIAYTDLDVSIIDQLPPGRQPVITSVISDEKREQVIEKVRNACREDKRQIYWVCTLIEESEEMQSQAAESTFQQLSEALPDVSVALIHGRMKSDEKQTIMLAFKQGKIDLLVATTVIEVGVDVPNASLMIIENPERL